MAVLHNARADATAGDRCLRLLALPETVPLDSCKTRVNSHDDCSSIVDASMPVALCLYGTGVLTLDGAHHGNKATNSNREYIEHVFTTYCNEHFCNGFVLYVTMSMKVEIHAHVVIRFSSIKHART